MSESTMRRDFAAPTCSIEIYPPHKSEANLALSGGAILSLTVEKDITQPQGTFSVVLAPSGPDGTIYYDWANVIVPMSLVLIGMQRAGRSNCVMVGIVTQINESTNWGKKGVQRAITISGVDFSYYFTMFNYYAYGLLGSLPGTVQGESLGVGAVAAQQLLGPGFSNGTPQQIGLNFISQAMFGAGFGLMQKTKVQYKNNAPLSLLDIFGTVFEEVDGANVLFDYDYVTTEQSWYSKFQNIFPAPWYDFFITTAPQGYYGFGKQTGQLAGYSFKMSSLAGNPDPVTVTAVARVNPTPVLKVTANGATTSVTGIDETRWNALDLFTPDEARPRQTNLQFSIDDTCNYFAINPTFAGTMYGAGNTLSNTWLLTQNTAIDTSSIIDLGFRPAVLPTAWFGNGSGEIAQNTSVQESFPQIAATLTARLVSSYGPLNLMAKASVILPLRPDIMPGQRFRFNPNKINETWDFMIQSVNHSFVFGGESTTTLLLTNGLPSVIYQNSNRSDALQNVHQGLAYRGGLGYENDLTRSGVQFFGPSSDQQAILSQVSSGYSNPGGTSPN